MNHAFKSAVVALMLAVGFAVVGFGGLVWRHMTPAQIAEAQKLAREWKPK
jgi:hypothetical protein